MCADAKESVRVAGGEFQRQRAMTGGVGVLAQLLLVRRKDADAAPACPVLFLKLNVLSRMDAIAAVSRSGLVRL
jgi:hypothetical protein